MFRLRMWRDASRTLLQPALRVVWFPFASAAKTAYVLWRLTCRLAHLLGASPRWMALLARLLIFSILISPALLQLVPYYVCSRSILRGIRYGPHRRNDFDVHLPAASVRFGPQAPGAPPVRPIVVLFAGGAWMIGYKLWTLALCRTLAALGIIAVAADYRNYPQCTTSGMVEDVSAAIDAAFALPEIAAAGGDPRLVYVWGQSAGAHLAACAVVERAVCETLEARAASEAAGVHGSGEGPDERVSAAAAALPTEAATAAAAPAPGCGGGLGGAGGRFSSSVSLVRLVHCGVDASAEFDDYAAPPLLAAGGDGGSDGGRATTPLSAAASLPPAQSPPRGERGGLLPRWGGDGAGGRLRAGGQWLFQRREGGGDAHGAPAGAFDTLQRATACPPPPRLDPSSSSSSSPRDAHKPAAAAAGADALPWGLEAEAPSHLDGGEAGVAEGGRILRRRVLDFPAAGGHGAAALSYEEVLVLQAAPQQPAALAVAVARPPTPHAPVLAAAEVASPPAAAAAASGGRPRVRRFFGVSGAYDIGAIAPSFQAKAGVPESFISAMFEDSIERYSPVLWFRACAGGGGSGGGGGGAYPPLNPSLMPPVSLFHGGGDLCVPPSSSLGFAAVLAAAGVPATATVFAGKSHTDPVVEDPLGGAEPLLESMLQLIWEDMRGGALKQQRPEKPEQLDPALLHGAVVAAAGALVPGPMLALARWVNPFS